MRRLSVILLASAAMLVALTAGLCAPSMQTRCIVDTSGIYLGFRNRVGWQEFYDIGPGRSITTWGVIEWSEIDNIRITHGLLGAYLSVVHVRGSMEIGPMNRWCEQAVRERLKGDPKFIQ